MTEPRRITEEIPTALAGERLDKVVAFIGGVSRAEAARMIADGEVIVDGAIATSGKIRLEAGQTVTIEIDDSTNGDLPGPDPGVPIEVVHVDDEIIVVNKASDVVVHPAPGHAAGTLVNGLLALHPELIDVGEPHRPGIVHRLDAGTSGLMVVARTSRAHLALTEAIAERRVGRIYRALVWGRLDKPSVVVDAPIGRSPRDPARMAVRPNGKPARTAVSVVSEFSSPAEITLVECRLESGRTHQIRVHLATIGHPVLGDATYGGARQALRCRRPMLHSQTLELDHPATGESMSWTVEPPADMAEVLAGLS